MAKSFKQFQEDWEFLPPASYDKKLLDTMYPSVEMDSRDFDAGNDTTTGITKDHSEDKPTTVKGNPETPVIAKYEELKDTSPKKDKSAPSKLKEDASDVENVYVAEVEDLLEEVADLFETVSFQGFSTSSSASAIAGSLRVLRDQLLESVQREEAPGYDIDEPVVAGEESFVESEELQELSKKTLKSYVKKANKSIDKEIKKGDPKKKAFNRNQGVERAQDRINEAFAAGSAIKLHDGSRVTLSTTDAGLLNKVFESEGGKSLEKTMMKNIHEFKAILDFAKTLHESVEETDGAKKKSKTEINASEEIADEQKEFADGKISVDEAYAVLEEGYQYVLTESLSQSIVKVMDDTLLRKIARGAKVISQYTAGAAAGSLIGALLGAIGGITLVALAKAEIKRRKEGKTKAITEAELMEVSKDTLASYVKKAQDKQRGNVLDIVHHHKFNDEEKRVKASDKYKKTDKYVKMAVDKLKGKDTK